MSNKLPKIYVAGYRGMVGSAIIREPQKQGGQRNIVLETHNELELTNQPYVVAKIAGIKLCESCNRQYGLDYH
jgi:GDP-L-fucose synthase